MSKFVTHLHQLFVPISYKLFLPGEGCLPSFSPLSHHFGEKPVAAQVGTYGIDSGVLVGSL